LLKSCDRNKMGPNGPLKTKRSKKHLAAGPRVTQHRHDAFLLVLFYLFDRILK
jgi:hypothetical protein